MSLGADQAGQIEGIIHTAGRGLYLVAPLMTSSGSTTVETLLSSGRGCPAGGIYGK